MKASRYFLFSYAAASYSALRFYRSFKHRLF